KINRYQTPLLDDGIQYVHVRAVDNAGNISKTVHYKLQISRSPIIISSLHSSTHREGMPEVAKDAEFTWDINPAELVRLKGFLIGISKDTVVEPTQFTTDFSAKFNGLEEGRYFFTVRALDKTNMPGSIFSYEIIVGKAAELDVEKIKKIARQIQEKEQTQEITFIKKRPKIIGPVIDVLFPFDTVKPFTENSFEVYLSPRNISEKYIEGYTIVLDTKKPTLGENINLKSNSFKVKNLKNGTYYLGYKAKYFIINEGRKRYFWSEPQVVTFTVNITLPTSPLISYSEGIVNKIAQRWITIALSFVAIMGALMSIGLGNRINFYMQYIFYKFFTFRKK
ncbi:MAG: hypothetical protein N2316_13805, partial [Spirochaetes bacterium]|nr:hypothetical protein [Spirochaetota bacterium]